MTFGPNGKYPGYPNNQGMHPNMNYPPNQHISSLESQNNSTTGLYNNYNQRNPNQNFVKNSHPDNYSESFYPGDTSPLNDHPIDIQGLGNYPDEWMYAMPDPGQYVEVPVHMEQGMPHPQFAETQMMDSPTMGSMGMGSPVMGSPEMGLMPGEIVYEQVNPVIYGDAGPVQGVPTMPVGPETQSIHSMVPSMYVNQYQDDCLYMNLEEEYLHKVSLQNKNDNELMNNGGQKN